jgi:RimJ/RimL family protein N-acetyltransferase
MAVNVASRRVMEKIGMTFTRVEHVEGMAPIPGSEHGDAWYEIGRAAWVSGQNAAR